MFGLSVIVALSVVFVVVIDVCRAQTICASIIMKDEETVIERFLTKNQFSFDHVDLVDTGSTDRTIEIAERIFATNHNFTGAIHHYKWRDHFGKARAFALETTRKNKNCKIITFMDADEELWLSSTKLPLTSDVERRQLADALIEQCPGICQLTLLVDGNLQWWRFYAINATYPVTWKGARHEFLSMTNDQSPYVINMFGYNVYARRDQSRLTRDKNALLFDVLALEHEVLSGENVPRAQYYVGQSYDQAGMKPEAIEAYRRRVANTDGWDQERYYAQLRIGLLVKDLWGFNASVPEFINAIAIDPTRAEAFYELAVGYRLLKNYLGCWIFAREGTRKRILNNVSGFIIIIVSF